MRLVFKKSILFIQHHKFDSTIFNMLLLYYKQLSNN